MSETIEMVSEGIKFRQVYHFDVSGHLMKIENYNDYHLDEDSLHLGEITYFEYTTGNSRSSFTLSADKSDTVKVTHYEFFGENNIKVYTENYSNSYFTEIIQTLDEKGRIVVTHGFISDRDNEEIYTASITRFIYDHDKLLKLIVVNDRTGAEGKEVYCHSRKYDEVGNLTHMEYQDEDGVIVSIVDKSYEYYGAEVK
ncbi:hypothetical protein O3Q51_14785 [Cryomorphaceae bacterium 1068]|nr:hypothetical protein [Cryomorphaceae bacterium 1068]